MASCLGLFASSSRRPRVTELETTTSTCVTEAVRRNHIFEIQGYSSLLGRISGAGDFVRSAAFEVGGHDWAIRYYPRGCSHAKRGHASVFVELTIPDAEAQASCELSLLPAARAPPVVYTSANRFHRDGLLKGSCSFVKTATVESPAYLVDDTIKIQCAVTVFMDPTNSWSHPILPAAAVPPPERPRDLDDKAERLKGLLKAAHLYGVGRLKVMCERDLCGGLEAGTVVATLALAEQLQCTTLRAACLEFICSMAGRGGSIG